MTSALIRPATDADLDPIVRCHIEVWRQTYSHLVPPELAEQLTNHATRTQRWTALLNEHGPNRQVVVAEVDGTLAGFGLFGAGDAATFGTSGEIKYLYVAARCQRHGIGRALLGTMAERLASVGYGSAALAVVRGNVQAVAFYERMGGRHVGDFMDPGPLWRSDNMLYRWDDLPALIARCRSKST